ncbi:MAG: hypothetical protein ACXWPM_06375 [Bdellovibrionota bacterium]
MKRQVLLIGLVLAAACSSLPEPKHAHYNFPEREAFVNEPGRPYQKLGAVKTKVNFNTVDPALDDKMLCRNYYNKATKDLVRRAKDVHGDAVIHIRSVVFYEDGQHEIFDRPECSDDGQEGQILLEAIAVKWLPEPAASASPRP